MTKLIVAVVTAFVILVSTFSAEAQQKVPLLGFLGQGKDSTHAGQYATFRKKMRGLGYVEGRTIRYAYRYAEGKKHRLAGLAAELVRLKPDVIVTHGTPPTRAARKATSTIPIVMSGADPVRSGLVKSFEPMRNMMKAMSGQSLGQRMKMGTQFSQAMATGNMPKMKGKSSASRRTVSKKDRRKKRRR